MPYKIFVMLHEIMYIRKYLAGFLTNLITHINLTVILLRGPIK